MTTKEPNDAPEKVATALSELAELNEGEISKLRSFLKTFQSRYCSIAQTCTCLLKILTHPKLLNVAIGLLIRVHRPYDTRSFRDI